MNFNITSDASVSNAPASFIADVADVARFYSELFTDPITINITVGYGEIHGTALPTSHVLGESSPAPYSASYSTIRNALAAKATSSEDASALANMPSSDPIQNGANGILLVSNAEAKSLGIVSPFLPPLAQDGSTGFSSNAPFDYDPYNRAASGEYDFLGSVEHEFSEVMGRVGFKQASAEPHLLDLFRYSAPGTPNYDPTQAGYFSINGGVTDLDDFNTDSSGDLSDWATTAGNDSYRAVSSSGVENTLSPADLTVLDVLGYTRAFTASDFNADGMSDVLWRNAAGETYLWQMNSANVTAAAPTSLQVDPSWQVQALGDFSNSRSAEILWRDTNAADANDGLTYLSYQNGAQQTGGGLTSWQVGANWQVAGAGKFLGSNAASDILWRYDDTANASDPLNGETYIWAMNGTQVQAQNSGATSLSGPNLNWQVSGIADFNGDGNSDILWRYNNTANASDPLDGATYMWTMNGTNVTSAAPTSEQAGANWNVMGTGDFFGDGYQDILWRYDNSANAGDPLNGETYLWEMNGANVQYAAPTSWQVDDSWTVAALGDFNGDGATDILWQQAATGNTYLWDMQGTNVLSGAPTSQQTGQGWTVQNGVVPA